MKRIIMTGIAVFFSLAAFPQNFGIGTSSPGEKLDVNGNIKASGIVLGGRTNQMWTASRTGGVNSASCTTIPGLHGERLFVPRGDVSWWGIWTYGSSVSLPAGNHNISIQTRASGGGNCHICVEVGNALTGYTNCDLIIRTVYNL